jgi:hypothetical protein
MKPIVEQLRPFVRLDDVVVEDTIAKLADSLEIDGILTNQLIKVFLWELIGNDEFLAEGSKVDWTAKNHSSKPKQVGGYTHITLWLVFVNDAKGLVDWFVEVQSHQLKFCFTLVDNVEIVAAAIETQHLVWLENTFQQFQSDCVLQIMAEMCQEK